MPIQVFPGIGQAFFRFFRIFYFPKGFAKTGRLLMTEIFYAQWPRPLTEITNAELVRLAQVDNVPAFQELFLALIPDAPRILLSLSPQSGASR